MPNQHQHSKKRGSLLKVLLLLPVIDISPSLPGKRKRLRKEILLHFPSSEHEADIAINANIVVPEDENANIVVPEDENADTVIPEDENKDK